MRKRFFLILIVFSVSQIKFSYGQNLTQAWEKTFYSDSISSMNQYVLDVEPCGNGYFVSTKDNQDVIVASYIVNDTVVWRRDTLTNYYPCSHNNDDPSPEDRQVLAKDSIGVFIMQKQVPSNLNMFGCVKAYTLTGALKYEIDFNQIEISSDCFLKEYTDSTFLVLFIYGAGISIYEVNYNGAIIRNTHQNINSYYIITFKHHLNSGNYHYLLYRAGNSSGGLYDEVMILDNQFNLIDKKVLNIQLSATYYKFLNYNNELFMGASIGSQTVCIAHFDSLLNLIDTTNQALLSGSDYKIISSYTVTQDSTLGLFVVPASGANGYSFFLFFKYSDLKLKHIYKYSNANADFIVKPIIDWPYLLFTATTNSSKISIFKKSQLLYNKTFTLTNITPAKCFYNRINNRICVWGETDQIYNNHNLSLIKHVNLDTTLVIKTTKIFDFANRKTLGFIDVIRVGDFYYSVYTTKSQHSSENDDEDMAIFKFDLQGNLVNKKYLDLNNTYHIYGYLSELNQNEIMIYLLKHIVVGSNQSEKLTLIQLDSSLNIIGTNNFTNILTDRISRPIQDGNYQYLIYADMDASTYDPIIRQMKFDGLNLVQDIHHVVGGYANTCYSLPDPFGNINRGKENTFLRNDTIFHFTSLVGSYFNNYIGLSFVTLKTSGELIDSSQYKIWYPSATGTQPYIFISDITVHKEKYYLAGRMQVNGHTNFDCFVVEADKQLNILSTNRIVLSNDTSYYPRTIEIDDDDNVYIGGYKQPDNSNNPYYTECSNSLETSRSFIFKFNPNYQLMRTFQLSSNDTCISSIINNIEIDLTGKLLVTGEIGYTRTKDRFYFQADTSLSVLNYSAADVDNFSNTSLHIVSKDEKGYLLQHDNSALNTIVGGTTFVRLNYDGPLVQPKQKSTAQHFLVYPNPSAGELFVEIPNVIEPNTSIQVSDLLGRTLKKQKVTENKFKMDLTQQQTGVYFITLSTNMYKETEKVILTK